MWKSNCERLRAIKKQNFKVRGACEYNGIDESN
jgi:hypothetical protein